MYFIYQKYQVLCFILNPQKNNSHFFLCLCNHFPSFSHHCRKSNSGKLIGILEVKYMGELFEKCTIPGYRGHFRNFSKQLHFTYGTKVQPLGYIKTLIQMGSVYGFQRYSKIVIYLPVTFITINPIYHKKKIHKLM